SYTNFPVVRINVPFSVNFISISLHSGANQPAHSGAIRHFPIWEVFPASFAEASWVKDITAKIKIKFFICSLLEKHNAEHSGASLRASCARRARTDALG